MKKFAISLIALAAISTASFAADRHHDHVNSGAYFGKYAVQLNDNSAGTNAFVVAKKWSHTLRPQSNFEHECHGNNATTAISIA